MSSAMPEIQASKKKPNTTDRNEITSTIYTIANVAHAEYHIIELIVNNIDELHPNDPLIKSVKKLRSMRSQMMDDLAKERPAMNGLWCVMKHLILAEMHCWEMYEKDGQTLNLNYAKDLHLMIDELLGINDYGKLEDCPRCEDDKK